LLRDVPPPAVDITCARDGIAAAACPIMQVILEEDLAGVTGGLTVLEAGRNAVSNVQQWGRAVWGRASLAAGFARDTTQSADAYSKQLERYDVHYKPVIPNQW
jgi:hypothetical protein